MWSFLIAFKVLFSSIITESLISDVDIAKIIRNNLNRSGQFNALSTEALITNQIDFNFWQEHKKDAVVFGKIEQVSTKVYNVYIYIYDVFSEKSLYQKKIRVHNSGFRRIAHFLSDKIYYVLLGQKGSFDTRLSYVTVSDNSSGGRTYKLQISDSDGSLELQSANFPGNVELSRTLFLLTNSLALLAASAALND